MSGFERSVRRLRQEIIPPVLENIERKNPATLVEHEGAEAGQQSSALREKLLPARMQKYLELELVSYPDGRYRARDIAGDPAIGTRHIHDFIVDIKTQEEGSRETTLFVVDPEHSLGTNKNRKALPLPRRGDVRPKVCVLYAVQLHSSEQAPDISILRYKSSAIDEPRLLKPEAQLSVAEDILRRPGVPSILEGKENKITFRLDVRDDLARVQSQLSNTNDLEKLLEGKPSSDMAEGQMRRFSIFMNYFLRHLRGEKEGVSFIALS